MTDELSMVAAFTSADLRLLSLGVDHLEDRLGETTDPMKRLGERIGLGNRVLRDRQELRRTEKVLSETKNDNSGYYSYAIDDNDAVQIRLRADELRAAVEGLEVFLIRPNPIRFAFDKTGTKLVDPPEKVRPLLNRLKDGLKGIEAAERIPALEEQLLS